MKYFIAATKMKVMRNVMNVIKNRFQKSLAIFELLTIIIPLLYCISHFLLALLDPRLCKKMWVWIEFVFLYITLLPSMIICVWGFLLNWTGNTKRAIYLDICLFILSLYYLTSSNVSPDNFLLAALALIPFIGRLWVFLLATLIFYHLIFASRLAAFLKRVLLFLGTIALIFLAVQVPSYNFPIPKDKIPGNLTPEMRKIIEKFYSPDATVRLEAVTKLSEKGSNAIPAIPFLIQSMQGMSGCENDIRIRAEDTLIKMGDVSIEPLTRAFQDPNNHPDLKLEAVWTLAMMYNPKTLESLALALDQEDWRIRATVIDGLQGLAMRGYPQSIECPQSMDLLIKCLRDKDERVREKALESLQLITGERFNSDPKVWQEWWEKHCNNF